ncbi:MAG: glycoside hydrolase family 31 protein [Niabella sp.]
MEMHLWLLKNRICFQIRGLLLGLLSLSSLAVWSQSGYKKISEGVWVYPDKSLSGNAALLSVQVISDKIIRVAALPEKMPVRNESLAVMPVHAKAVWTVAEAPGNKIVLSTKYIQATIGLKTGAVSFADRKGHTLLSERPVTGRLLKPVVMEGQPLYGIRQTFDISADDAYYGLGQHQEDAYNYKGQQVFLFQNNTEVAVPFLVSRKNYGLLWDNYSLTKVGDVRNYQPLSSLMLFDKEGNQGWLTATYSNDKNNPQEDMVQAASEINYACVNDSKLLLPAAFKPDKGRVSWEGSIASGAEGMHKIRLTYAGYVRIWINGELLFDKWRQAWNPGSGVIPFNFEKNKKYAIRIQWVPDGGESYLTVKWLPPVDKENVNSFVFDSEAGRQLDYYFVYGDNTDDVISGYRQLTGKAVLMPKWAMGFWQSRERYKTQQELTAVVKEFRKRKIPLDNIVLDWSYWREAEWGSQDFDENRFPDPDAMIKKVHDDHAQIMISVWPKFYEGIPAYDSFNAKGWLYKRNIADRQKDWIGQGYVSTFYDAFNAGARKGFWELISKKLYSRGIDAWWMDASEPDILSNVSPERRKQQMSPTALGTAAQYLNAYPLQNAKGIYEGQRSTGPGKRVFLLTRSGFAGSQRYAAAIWSGDIASRWEDMKAQISAGINFSLSGLPYWTMDIGGFSVERRYEKPDSDNLDEWRELNTRWYQFGAFVPLFRVHGQFPFREIYNIAPESHPAYKSMLYYNKLRYRLMPYIYSLAGGAYHHDATIMRGLVFDFAADTMVTDIGDQYMFGPSLLVNPVYTYKATSRKLYLPQGQVWFDLYTGKQYDGGTFITAAAPYERMPVFVKAGAIIPAGPLLQYTGEKPADPVTLYVYAGKDGSFTLYEDEGLNYNYEKGKYTEINCTYDDAARTFTIDNRQGGFNGMLKQRTFFIKYITKDKPAAFSLEEKEGRPVKYSGKKIIVKL